MQDQWVPEREFSAGAEAAPGIDPETAAQLVLTEARYLKLQVSLASEYGADRMGPAVHCRDLSPFGR